LVSAVGVVEPTTADISPPAVSGLFDRVAVIGASATCGFGVQSDIEGPYGPTTAPADMGTAIQAVFDVLGPVNRQCSFFFFSDPMTVGPALMNAALQGDPTIVFALDYLFWYGYGSRDVHGRPFRGNETARLELLEAGLKQLERCRCPVVVGDFPDMHAAIGLMLGAAQVPNVETLKLLNARLRDWAADRPNVIIVPLSEFVSAMTGGGAFDVGGSAWIGEEARKKIIQPDRLHPTAEGLVLMAERAAEAMAAAHIGLTADMYENNHTSAMKRLKAVLEQRRGGSQGGASASRAPGWNISLHAAAQGPPGI
jgi:hypothetical protein